MSPEAIVGKSGNLKFNADSVKKVVAVYHDVESGTVSLKYLQDSDPMSPMSSFEMCPGDDKMLVGKSQNVGSLVQLLWPLTGYPFYKVTTDHLEYINLELFIRSDLLEDPRFAGHRTTAGPMNY